MALEERLRVVRVNKLCHNCLNRHRRQCFLRKVCGINGCSQSHHPLIHRGLQPDALRAAVTSDISDEVPHHHNGLLHTHRHMENTNFHEGSSVTLIDRKVFEQLNVRGVRQSHCLRWTNNTTHTDHASERASLNISNARTGSKFKLRDVHSVESLNLPAQSVDMSELAQRFRYLKGLPIESYQNARPTVLIGANNWHLAVPLKIREGAWNQPIASKTRLGWTLQSCNTSRPATERVNVHVCSCSRLDANLHEAIKQTFGMETATQHKLLSAEDRQALSHLQSTAVFNDGRYEVGLPWKDADIPLPESYPNALNRLKCLQRKFLKQSELREQTQKEVDNLINKGYARKLTSKEIADQNERAWYLPTFITINPNKPGRVRLVWDAAAQSNGKCLNDYLLRGPDLLQPLFDLLVSFRVGQVAICGDIAEMFHQIRVRPTDAHAQRFLWWDNGEKAGQPSVYSMSALTFGINCAPFIAHYVRDANAEHFQNIYPTAANAIKNYHYVDDFLYSDVSVEAVTTISTQVKHIHSAGGFNIRNWSSNSEEVLRKLDATTNSPLQVEIAATEKVLGLYWMPKPDKFVFNLKFARLKRNVLGEDVPPTKRELLQVLMSIYDPLGFISCYTIALKILLQEVCRSSINWDERLPFELVPKWAQWKRSLPIIAAIQIPRCYFHSDDHVSDVQLHTFVDASEMAYAAVCYLRICHGESTYLSFAASKAKVAPLSPVSIPRMELQAAVIGARLSKQILSITTSNKILLVLVRLQNRPKLAAYGPTEISAPSQWPSPCQLGTTREEIRQGLLAIHTETHRPLLNEEYFSDWRRLYRALAVFLLYMERLRAKVRKEPLPRSVSCQLVQQAQIILWRYAQASEFAPEIQCLDRDHHKLLRICGRAENLNSQQQIVLPYAHPITRLIVVWHHNEMHHTSHEACINRIRGTFYIPRLRVLYKNVRKSCQRCRLETARPDVPQMAALPAARLASFQRPFTYVGIDYFGPMLVSVGRRREKRWVVIFTCLTIRAVHLELANSLDTASCVMVIRNFINRRGSPREIYSDNGTNFKAAEKIICEESLRIDY
ncbi:uncharacterized protein [Drosophila takahashii]|uniref:uncharacterized protein n=1 Tax=Drosophila takahashii TaxID=29030 RepID=UPI00389952C0